MNQPTTPSLAITWQQPTFLLPLFCLAPLLGASNSLALAIALSLLMLCITSSTLLLVHVSRSFIPPSLHSTAWLIVSSTIVAIAELLLHAWSYELFRALGLFIPLMVIACLVISRPEMHEANAAAKLIRLIRMNAGFTFAAVVLGTAREIIGHGSLFNDAGEILGPSWKNMSVTLFPSDMGFLLGVLAPGAFIGLGIGVALYNWIWLHLPSQMSSKNTDHAQR